MNKILHSNLY